MVDSKAPEVKTEEVTDTKSVDVKQSNPDQEVSNSKTFSLDEFNNAMASVRKQTEEKVLKKFSDVDVEKYRELIQKEEQRELEEKKKRGEFEKILKETAEKKDSQINQLRDQLNSVKVDGAVLNAASKYKAVSPQQVARLVKDRVRLNDAGEVEVVGDTGAPRYTESGELMSVDALVNEFLQQNPHFVQAGPSGSGSKSNTNPKGIESVDISKLDLNNPEHKRMYAEYRKQVNSGVKRMF